MSDSAATAADAPSPHAAPNVAPATASRESRSTRPRIGIAGIAIESSTFTPYRSGAADFEVRRGTAEILDRYPFEVPEAEYVGVLHARALPGGVLERAVYDSWKQEILDGLTGQDLDGFFFDIHGAMSVEGLDDAEGDLITAIRSVIGPRPIVGTAMDLHGNVSHTLFDACDLLTCYRHAPHIDAWETRERGLRDLVEHAARGHRPHKALVHVPILLPGEKTSTRIEPAKSLYEKIPGLLEHPGVRDISCWVGFAWADQPRCKAAIVAFGDDQQAVEDAALELATALWQARHDFVFVAPTASFTDCLDRAITSDARPFWISDSGDNPGAGGADDTTGCLAELIARPEIRSAQISALMVSLVDPAATNAAVLAGIGGRIDVEVGGHIDTREPGPVPLRAEVTALAQHPTVGEQAAALRVLHGEEPTGLTVVVTARRSQWCTHAQFDCLGLSMTGFDVVTVKMGYLEPDQYDSAADWLLALTPGGVDQDLQRLGHTHIDRPMIPFDAEIPAPARVDVRSGSIPPSSPESREDL